MRLARQTAPVTPGREVRNLLLVPAGNRILAATERLQLWAPPLTDALIEEEDGQLTEDRPHPVLNDWNCVWQCKYVPLQTGFRLLPRAAAGKKLSRRSRLNVGGRRRCILKILLALLLIYQHIMPTQCQAALLEVLMFFHSPPFTNCSCLVKT